MRDWVCILDVHGASQPGVAARITRVFADRGLSLDELLATTHAGRSLVLLRFAATDRHRDYMRRRLERIAEVHRVEVVAGDARPIWGYLEARA